MCCEVNAKKPKLYITLRLTSTKYMDISKLDKDSTVVNVNESINAPLIINKEVD